MTADAIARVTGEIKARLEVAVGGTISVGPPVAENVVGHKAALFLFHVLPNQHLRNSQHHVDRAGDPTGPLAVAEALPLDLRYLIAVFRTTGTGGGGQGDPDELDTLGRVVRALHAQPTIDDNQVPGQLVRLTPEPYPMEELSRVWGLFPQTSYTTSVVYLASPVYVSLDAVVGQAPVAERRTRHGQLASSSAPAPVPPGGGP